MNITLYKGHKNSIGFWNIQVAVLNEAYKNPSPSDWAEIIISHSVRLEGKSVVNTEVISEGKNIGKANETTPYEQAVLEAESRVRKQLDKGYVRNVEDIKQYPTNALGYAMPVLATPVEKVKKLDFTHAFIQPKLDGHRCPAIRLKESVVMYSRQGKLIETLPHIKEELMDTLEAGEHLDGELYNHSMTLQEISSAVKKSQDMSKEIQYHVYDAISEEDCFEDRFWHRYYSDDTSGSVLAVPTYPVTCIEEAWDWFAAFRAKGYEGAILRLGNSGYEIGRRSKNLLKLKGFEDAEYIVKAVTEGTERNINDTKFRVGILNCVTAEGKEFTVTAPGTAVDKHLVAENPKDYIGREVTVKFANLTPDGVPFHPVALQFKEYI